MITGDNITDEQIRELRDADPLAQHVAFGQVWSLWQLCMDAMRQPDYAKGDARVRLWPIDKARARCAEILNARKDGV